MPTFFTVTKRWVEQRETTNDHQVRLSFREGPPGVPNRSVSVAFETPIALGVVSVWELGDIEAEVLEIESEDRVFVYSGMLEGAEQLRVVLQSTYDAVRSGG